MDLIKQSWKMIHCMALNVLYTKDWHQCAAVWLTYREMPSRLHTAVAPFDSSHFRCNLMLFGPLKPSNAWRICSAVTGEDSLFWKTERYQTAATYQCIPESLSLKLTEEKSPLHSYKMPTFYEAMKKEFFFPLREKKWGLRGDKNGFVNE